MWSVYYSKSLLDLRNSMELDELSFVKFRMNSVFETGYILQANGWLRSKPL